MKGKRPWDDAGHLIPGVTVQEWLEFLYESGYSGNVSVDCVRYNFHSLRIAPPDGIDLTAEITAMDSGYYGTPGVRTR